MAGGGSHGGGPDDADADDTVPFSVVPLPRDAGAPGEFETPPRGLRKFDLGTVPASVTPPRTWRKAAWFAVGTSAAVACGLAVAAVRLVGAPPPSDTIDALPAYPTEPLAIEELPVQHTSDVPTPGGDRSPDSPVHRSPSANERTHGGGPTPTPTPASPVEPGPTSSTPATPTTNSTDPTPPSRTTIGSALITPADPEELGDRTEQYFALVTENPEAAHELCGGDMAREGPEAIEARYSGVERVEVQQITIDRAQAVTTSTVKLVREDGTTALERRQLTFTWGGDPKISDETTTD